MDTQTQIERLIELAIVQRTELRELVEQLPTLREHLNAEIERTFEETEPQIRTELEEFCRARATDEHAKTGAALAAKVEELSKQLEVTTAAKYSVLMAERAENANLLAKAEARIEDAASMLSGAVKEIVTDELSRFPRAGEIDQLRKEFAEPRGLNPRGRWMPDETYQRLDLVTINGDSFVSNIDGNRERPSRTAGDWTLSAARGNGGGGGGVTTMTDLVPVPSNGQLLIGNGSAFVNSTLTAGTGISISNGAGSITINATDGNITLDDGTAAAPALNFTNYPTTGLYSSAANAIGFATSGVARAAISSTGLAVTGTITPTGSVHAAAGTVGNPSLAFNADQDTGLYSIGANNIGVAVGGAKVLDVASTGLTVTGALGASSLTSPAASNLTLGTGSFGTALTVANATGAVTAATTLADQGGTIAAQRNGLAPRQGLSYAGVGGANVTATVAAYGTTGFTNAITFSVDSLSAQQAIIDSNNGILVFVTTAGSLQIYNRVGAAYLYQSAAGLIVAGQINHVVYARGAVYLNGVLLLGSISDTSNYTGTTVFFGGDYTGGTPLFGRIYGSPLILNRALSAAEVLTLYQTGAVAAGDINNASNTAINTVSFADGVSGGATCVASGGSFSGASATGCTAVGGGGSFAAVSAQDPFTISPGQKIRVTYTAVVNSGTVALALVNGAVSGISNEHTVTTGTRSVELTATGYSTSSRVCFYGPGGVTFNVVISSVAVTRIGALIAPDSAQVGGGLEWLDVSGNRAHIILPTSGVSWSLPSSQQIVIEASTSTNGNQQLGGASLIDANKQWRIQSWTVNCSTGTPTISLGNVSAGTQYVSGAVMASGNNDITLVTRFPSTANLWVNSSTTATLIHRITLVPAN